MIRDRQNGPCAAGDSELPLTNKAHCCKRLVDNARKPGNAGGKGWSNADFYSLQGSITEAAFKHELECLTLKAKEAARYFNNIPHEEWALYMQIEKGFRMYGWRNSNFVELEDSRLLPARHEAPFGCLHKISLLMSSEANAARMAAQKMLNDKAVLTPFAEQELEVQRLLARSCSVQRVSDSIGLVKQSFETQSVEHTVNFSSKECSCGEWQQTGRPCRHAIAFAPKYFGRSFTTEPEQWIEFGWEPCYLAEQYIKATGEAIVLPPNKAVLMPDRETKPPLATSTGGRPRKRRIRSAAGQNGNNRAGKPYRPHKCRRCGRAGHHVTTCTEEVNFVDLTDGSLPERR